MVKRSLILFLQFFLLSANTHSQTKKNNDLKINDPAPIFTLRNLDNENIFIRDYCGNLRQPWKNKVKHVVIISFFTTYCQPCIKEIHELMDIYTDYKTHDFKVFLLDLREKKETVHKFIEVNKINLPVLLDKYGVVAKKYAVTSVPRIFVINRDGKLIWKTKGYSENLNDNLRAVLQQEFKQESEN